MVKRPRRSTVRRKPNRSSTSIARISTGVPVTTRRLRSDPPPLPHVVAYPVRTRFMLVVRATASGGGTTNVILSSTPYGPNNVFFDFTSAGISGLSPSVTLSYNEVFTAAAMRLFGVDVTADTSSANFVLTDYAIQKVVLYGSDNDQALSRDLVLSAEFGSDIPGFIGRDAGNRMSRPVVGATPPRLSWRKIIQNDSKICFNIGVNLMTSQFLVDFRANNNPIVNGMSWHYATLDVTVLVRRSFITPPSVTARSVAFSKGDDIV